MPSQRRCLGCKAAAMKEAPLVRVYTRRDQTNYHVQLCRSCWGAQLDMLEAACIAKKMSLWHPLWASPSEDAHVEHIDSEVRENVQP
jgi:hypothetical protein